MAHRRSGSLTAPKKSSPQASCAARSDSESAQDSYLRNAVDRDVAEQGLVVRRPDSMLAWLRAYAAATSSTTSYPHLLNAATQEQSVKPARSTSIAYRGVLTQLWLLDPVPARETAGNVLARLGQASQNHLADPALAARLLGLASTRSSTARGSRASPGTRR